MATLNANEKRGAPHLRFLVFQITQRELRLKKVELGGMQPEEKDLRQRTKEFALQITRVFFRVAENDRRVSAG